MGKNKQKGMGIVDADLRQIEEAQRDLEKKKRQLAIKCNHRTKHGEFNFSPEGSTIVKCNSCKDEFDIARIKKDTLEESVQVIHSAIQQIRMLSNPEEDKHVIKSLGDLDYNLRSIPDIYRRVDEVHGKNKGKNKNKNKNKNRGGNSIGAYGGMVDVLTGHNRRR